ncbi:helix-turn-helix domain-containing protein [Streptomyces palmae]|uniref:helix-turn-helix domain-containing protein n=1 Tax=Streptomyces palmae TaxID=1701085 RepID=UPI001432DB69|nr:XRE family transcriptional regulator [Streptomyces palmae]
MGRWGPLREDLPVEVVRLVRELRQHMDRCELSTTTIAVRTGYSRSSWLRYVNGRRLPPWQAVEKLGRLVEADAEHLRVLWESASHAWAGGDRTEALLAPVGPDEHAGEPAQERADEHPDVPGAPSTTPASAPATAPSSEPAPGTAAVGRVWWRAPWVRWAAVSVALVANGALLAALLFARQEGAPTADVGIPADAPSIEPPNEPTLVAGAEGADGRSADGCRSSGCRGLDPYREKCDRRSVTVHRLRAYDHVLTLRYSSACKASWAEIDTSRGTAQLRISTTAGDQQRAAAGRTHTAMLDGEQNTIRATVTVAGHQLGIALYDSWIDPVGGSGTG